MARVQVNLRLDASLVREVERLVEQGHFDSKTEAFTRALRLLIRRYKASELMERINQIREGTEGLPSLTETIVEAHEEEDLP
ncbi:TPA: ribbon-helix-helix protein, CopG family [Candidatus Bathyarchaeota archaeon]|nr:ribbon-helix-helix protein, CopG family [Candidatus Bathyarchaeota archaeon]